MSLGLADRTCGTHWHPAATAIQL